MLTKNSIQLQNGIQVTNFSSFTLLSNASIGNGFQCWWNSYIWGQNGNEGTLAETCATGNYDFVNIRMELTLILKEAPTNIGMTWQGTYLDIAIWVRRCT